jgi:hypothetical protein
MWGQIPTLGLNLRKDLPYAISPPFPFVAYRKEQLRISNS